MSNWSLDCLFAIMQVLRISARICTVVYVVVKQTDVVCLNADKTASIEDIQQFDIYHSGNEKFFNF